MEKTHLTLKIDRYLNRHTSQSTIIKDINIYEFLDAKALIQYIDNFINRDVVLVCTSSINVETLGQWYVYSNHAYADLPISAQGC